MINTMLMVSTALLILVGLLLTLGGVNKRTRALGVMILVTATVNVFALL